MKARSEKPKKSMLEKTFFASASTLSLFDESMAFFKSQGAVDKAIATLHLPQNSAPPTLSQFNESIAFFKSQDEVDTAITNLHLTKDIELIFTRIYYFCLAIGQIRAACKIYEFAPVSPVFRNVKEAMLLKTMTMSIASELEKEALQKDNLAERFYQNDTTLQRKYTGLAIGMSIYVRRVLHLANSKSSPDMIEFLQEITASVDEISKKLLEPDATFDLFSLTQIMSEFYSLYNKKIIAGGRPAAAGSLTTLLLITYFAYMYGSEAVLDRNKILTSDQVTPPTKIIKKIHDEKKESAPLPTKISIANTLMMDGTKELHPLVNRIKNIKPITNVDDLKILHQFFRRKTFQRLEDIACCLIQLHCYEEAYQIFSFLPFDKNEGIQINDITRNAPKESISILRGDTSYLRASVDRRLALFRNTSFTNHLDLIQAFEKLIFNYDLSSFLLELNKMIKIKGAKDGYNCAAIYLTEYVKIILETTAQAREEKKHEITESKKIEPAQEQEIKESEEKTEKKEEKPISLTTTETSSVKEKIKIFTDEDEMKLALQKINDSLNSITRLHALATFLASAGNITPAIILLKFLEKTPEAKDIEISPTRKLIESDREPLQRDATSSSFLGRLRKHRPSYFKTKERLDGLKDKIRTLPAEQRRNLNNAFEAWENSPYVLDKVAKTLTTNDIPINVIEFILREYCLIVFANPTLGALYPSYPAPTIRIPNNSVATISQQLTKKTDPLHSSKYKNKKSSSLPPPLKPASIIKEPSAVIEEKNKLNLTPTFLEGDRRLVKFTESVERLKKISHPEEKDLEDAYAALVSFRHELLSMEASLDEPEIIPYVKHYRLSLDAMYSADIALHLALLYSEQNRTKEAKEKLEWGRRFCYVDHHADELLIEQYKILLIKEDASKHPALHSAIAQVTRDIAEKKSYAKKLRKIYPDMDVKEAALKMIAQTEKETDAKISAEESKYEPEHKESHIYFAPLLIGDAQSCFKTALSELEKGKIFLNTDPTKSKEHLILSILLFQQVNGLLTVKSARLAEHSSENIALLKYRESVVAIKKAEATMLLNPTQNNHNLNAEQLLERLNIIENALRYISDEDTRSNSIAITLQNEKTNISIQLQKLQDNVSPTTIHKPHYSSRFYQPINIRHSSPAPEESKRKFLKNGS